MLCCIVPDGACVCVCVYVCLIDMWNPKKREFLSLTFAFQLLFFSSANSHSLWCGTTCGNSMLVVMVLVVCVCV